MQTGAHVIGDGDWNDAVNHNFNGPLALSTHREQEQNKPYRERALEESNANIFFRGDDIEMSMSFLTAVAFPYWA